MFNNKGGCLDFGTSGLSNCSFLAENIIFYILGEQPDSGIGIEFEMGFGMGFGLEFGMEWNGME